MNSENVKIVVDHFGRLSFVLETYVKLIQTGDHTDIADSLLVAAIKDAAKLLASLEQLSPVENE